MLQAIYMKSVRYFRRLVHDDAGAQSITFALALLPILAAVAGGVDVSRAYLVKARLNQALDAAALAGGRVFFLEHRDEDIQSYFDANFENGFMGATPSALDIAEVTEPGEPERLKVSGNAELPALFAGILGIDTMTVSAVSEVTRQNVGLQVALVLDNTGSMNGSRIDDLRIASNTLIDIIFGSYTAEPHPKLDVAIVPYSASVNIGSLFEGANNTASHIESMVSFDHVPPDYTFNPESEQHWKGCVEARSTVSLVSDDMTEIDSGANDLTVTPPSVGGKWPAYRYPHHYDNQYASLPFSGNTQGAAGDTWQDMDPSEKGPNPNRSYEQGFGPAGEVWPRPDTDPSRGNSYTGPNIGCPAPILPLTSDYQTVKTYLDGNIDAWFRGGTLGSIGLAWGWRVLDPQEPYTNDVGYADVSFEKAIVVMTDGENQMWRLPTGQRADADGDGNDSLPGNMDSDVPGGSDYGAYGRIGGSGDNRLGVSSRSEGADEVNKRMRKICHAMKNASGDDDGRDDVIVYTVLFGSVANSGDHDADTDPDTGLLATADSNLDSNGRLRKAYLECATGPDRYFLAPSGTDLNDAFRAIGNDLANLHVSQ